LGYPLPLDDGEGHVLNQAILIASGQLPYSPINVAPYIVTNYPPLFPAIAASTFRFLGEMPVMTGVTVFPGLIVTRLISVLSGLAIAFLIYRVSIKSGGNSDTSAISSLLFLAMPIVYFWFSIGKPDLLAIFLGLFGLYIGIANLEKGKRFYLALIPLILAVFTRQSEIAPFLALTAFLFLKKDKRAVTFTIVYLVSIIAVTLILQIATNGEYLKHIITYTRTQFYLPRLWSTWSFFFLNASLLLVVAFFHSAKEFSKRILSPALLYFCFAFLISLTSGKIGSDLNYFLETIVAAHILLAVFLNYLLKEKVEFSGSLIATCLVFLIALDYAFIHDNRKYSYQPDKDDRTYATILVSMIKDREGPILSEDEGFPAICGKEVQFNPFIMTELSKEGIWDQTDFVNSIENKKYDLIILRFDVTNPNHEDKPGLGGYAGWDRWTEEMELAIRKNYKNYAAIPLRRQWYLYFPLRPEIIEKYGKPGG
ncbi:glycosyltransferase family 39 protein, partial [bacterium]|nr:glycosyltransferase family 39 protein [bacterium]MBU1024723.1 glycosyltransferase family 39 protein [bacterium]